MQQHGHTWHTLSESPANRRVEGKPPMFRKGGVGPLAPREHLDVSMVRLLEPPQELHETWIVSPFFLDPAMASSRIAGGERLSFNS